MNYQLNFYSTVTTMVRWYAQQILILFVVDQTMTHDSDCTTTTIGTGLVLTELVHGVYILHARQQRGLSCEIRIQIE